MTAWRTQGFRYAAVGVVSNVVLYLFYLALTATGIGHKTAMTMLFLVGTLQTFVFHRRWTFRHDGRVPSSLLRYFVAYGGCYLLNLGLLYTLVDRLGFSHLPVQGAAIVLIAALLFLIQRIWVFPIPPEQSVEAAAPV